jgi:hypothetical protein
VFGAEGADAKLTSALANRGTGGVEVAAAAKLTILGEHAAHRRRVDRGIDGTGAFDNGIAAVYIGARHRVRVLVGHQGRGPHATAWAHVTAQSAVVVVDDHGVRQGRKTTAAAVTRHRRVVAGATRTQQDTQKKTAYPFKPAPPAHDLKASWSGDKAPGQQRQALPMIPVSIRRWFLAHFALNVLIGAPLLLIPKTFLGGMGWITIDPASTRFCGAALLAVGIQSLLTCNEGHHALRTMLNFKMVWSWAAIAGLVFAAAEGAPNPVWAFLALFIATSGLWFHLRVQLAEYMDHGAPMSGELPIFPLSPQLQAAAVAPEVDEVSDQFFVEEPAPPAAPLPRVVLRPRGPGAEVLGDAPIDDRSANSLVSLLGDKNAASNAAGDDAESPSDSDAEPAVPDPESLGADDIAAMLAKSGDEPAEAPAVENTEAPEAPEAAQADAEVPAAATEATADVTDGPPPVETSEANETAAFTREAVAETNETNESNEAPVDISEAPEPNPPLDLATPQADEMSPEMVVAVAEDESIIDDALAAVDALAPVERAESTPETILIDEVKNEITDEITNETSVEQIEQSVALDDGANGAAVSTGEPAKPSAPPVPAAEEIRKAIDSVLRPQTGKQVPPPPPPSRTLNGLPVFRLEEETAAANVEPDKTDDEELGNDAIAAMLAANRG